MIKNIALATLLLSTGSSVLQAEEHKNSNEFYVVAKALYTIGKTIPEGVSILKGKSGKGMGIDIGYTLPYNFALELDTSYSKNDITEYSDGEVRALTAKYWTYAVDVTYTLPVTHSLALMGKAGYEFEHEKLDGRTKKDNGMVYGAGVEYHINEHYEGIVEYEDSTIDSARGSSVYAGIKYIF
ncbi:porin family protein [Sulfurimonas sp. C5]|uniref:porin family protein n=1 Tax=Sulfurimonas sp. C5 TaxID=3036947 RepID=UPI002453AC91|nr:porin family protein [Sulfurimonas sp. C5]MDH4945036.1 porin family protein [Sulfurimonas sp. C5]